MSSHSIAMPAVCTVQPTSLRFRSVTKWYGAVAALMDVSFEVGCEVVGLVGRNGVGKSTLMKLAVGLLRPSQGEVVVGPHPASTAAARASIGFCPDFDRLYERVSGVTFVSWMLRYHGVRRRAADVRASEVLSELGLAEDMHRPIREYSKGMRQRVRLGQALAHRPAFVLLDEPMTGLDPLARAELAQHIRALPGRGVGVLVSSHVLHELEAVVDRVVLVHQGRLLAEGAIAELRDRLPARPHRLRVRGAAARQLAAQLVAWPDVVAVEVADEAIDVSLTGAASFYERLTALAATWPGGIDEILPLDDDLAAVFGYLVE
ncbi:MAG: ABC transporter ATP-binding protein [Planctomycetes bacterium]|nr:ABC transporter ATP-binding protein [Planctomycetota bacterium]